MQYNWCGKGEKQSFGILKLKNTIVSKYNSQICWNLCIYSILSNAMGTPPPPIGDGHSRKASTSHCSYTHSLHVLILLSHQQLSHMHSFTLSTHLPSNYLLVWSSTSLTSTFFTNSSCFILSTWLNHLNIFLLTHSTIVHLTQPTWVPLIIPVMHTLYSHPPPWHNSDVPLRWLFSTAHTLDPCALFHVQNSDPFVSAEMRMIFLSLHKQSYSFSLATL